MATIIMNGVVLTRENIAFLKEIQIKAREERIAKIKNFGAPSVPALPCLKKQKTKISHAQRRARRVALSIAADPRNKGMSKK